MNQIYYVLTPPGVTMCLDEGGEEGRCSDFAATEESYENSFCSYHGAINPGGPDERQRQHDPLRRDPMVGRRLRRLSPSGR